MSGDKFYALRVTMKEARTHLSLITGDIQEGEFEKLYRKNEGFTVEFDDTNDGGSDGGRTLKHTFFWKDVVEHSRDIMFFGPPFV